MQVKAHDLRQLDADALRRLHRRDPDALVNLSVRLLDDLKEAHERLSQSSQNSSRPPSSCGPWHKATADEEEPGEEDEGDPMSAPTDAADTEADACGPSAGAATATADEEQQVGKPRKKAAARRPGKQKGAPGVARTQQLAITATLDHRPHACACCQRALPPERAQPFTAFGAVGVELGSEPIPSLRLTHTWHVYCEARCDCRHVTREEPYRAPPDTVNWEGVEVAQWRLIDSSLAGLLVWLNLRMRLSTRLIRELLSETLGLELSVGAIRTSLLESARAADPVQELILEALIGCESQLAHADETPHPQGETDLWLWTLVSLYAVVFVIGSRSKATFAKLLGTLYSGWLMTDGYLVYRDYPKRLRCWAHPRRLRPGAGREPLQLADILWSARAGAPAGDAVSGLRRPRDRPPTVLRAAPVPGPSGCPARLVPEHAGVHARKDTPTRGRISQRLGRHLPRLGLPAPAVDQQRGGTDLTTLGDPASDHLRYPYPAGESCSLGPRRHHRDLSPTRSFAFALPPTGYRRRSPGTRHAPSSSHPTDCGGGERLRRSAHSTHLRS